MGITFQSIGQYSIDSLDLDQDVSEWFDSKLGKDHTYLVSGTYGRIFVARNSHPFFEYRSAIPGTLGYKNEVFKKVDILYNTEEDYVAIIHPTNREIYSQLIRLNQPSIDWFEINGNLFRRFIEYDKKGFYQVLVKSEKFFLVSKRLKLKETNSSSHTVEFSSRDTYYFFMEGIIYPVRGKSGFVKTFPDLKKKIKTYARSNGLRIRSNHEEDIIELAKYCDQLINQE